MTRTNPLAPQRPFASAGAAVLLLVIGLLAAACGGGGGSEPAAGTPASGSQSGGAIPEAARAEAQQIFATRCTPCHGPQGKGDGPASAGLSPKPRNYTLEEWQDSVTDEHIEKVILYGGPAVGLSAAMPPNPDLASKPDVVRALRAHVRSLGAH